MKKIISLILSIIMIVMFTMPMKVYAATNTSKAGIVSVMSGRLNVRSSSSTSASVVTTLNKGTYVTLISKSGSWWRVEYGKNQYGYCHEEYITSVSGSPATVKIQSGSLNVRSGAGTAYTKTGSLSKGETVIVLSTSGGWGRILYHGTKTGYVSTRYLSATSSVYSAVSLSVPDFKQTDSRWANVTIGNSGKTIRQSGCAITALAMIESYRTGKTIYPDSMSGKLTYSSNGDLYWPGDYIPVTSGAGYLNAIYEQLKLGKTVLFGAKNTSGKQHWVVITGFTGGNILTASGFTINDPGSNYRTNLQQFLNVYPNFYKYFYYK